MSIKHPAEVFAPGDSLQEEIEARGWTPTDFAEITGIPVASMQAILVGDQPLTADIAARIGEALDTGAEVWLNLDAAYQRFLTSAYQTATISGGEHS